jgi:hypothetical protein
MLADNYAERALTDIQSKDFTIEGVDFFDVKIVKNFA